ncbi:glutamic acid-rich protein-like [Sinocyclocheilus rhinocerous]|uniref:glutamic acid-rich protein-like n=1 Tax=Sinocyclocheilus rhinocerous TaxID=307959 RepID=UPI0007B957C2|nr:PREDICTED: glutamic acid-rich protein-like [Sinocyclocheilus rhinocerous]XP_016422255.1 PREDICTED: glutamic acid-rich protein-like [Sinocyclocheilus rhinocerous]
MNGKVDGEDEEEDYLDEEEDEDEEEEEEHPEEEEEGEKCDEKEDILDEKRKETKEQEQSITEPDIQKRQIMKDASVPDGPKKDSDPATLIKEETQSERNEVTEDKPKTLFGSRNRLSLFKRASTKGNKAEIVTSGKPGADGPPQIPETREPESSSSGAQTTASSRSHSATCNLL